MQPGLYVVAPIGLGNVEGEVPTPVPLVDSVELASFDPKWKDNALRFLESIRKRYGGLSDMAISEFATTRHCLVLRFADPGAGRPIDPEVFDQGEFTIGQRVRARDGLAKGWLRSLAVLAIAGRIHFGCFEWWFGFKVAEPPEEHSCHEVRRVGWYGRVVANEKREAMNNEYWDRVRTIARNLANCKHDSRPAVAADMFARAVFADDWRVEMLCYWIALEALFGQTDTELSHQLCERAAAWNELPGEGRHELYRELKAAYRLRSKLVHGSLVISREQDREDLSAAIDVVEGATRNALCRLLMDQDMTALFMQERQLTEYFEKAVLAPEASARPDSMPAPDAHPQAG